MTTHLPHHSLPSPRVHRIASALCALVAAVVLVIPSQARAQDNLTPSPLTNLPALTTFALTHNASPRLHELLDQRTTLEHHKDLHVMTHDVRQRQNKRHWVFPTIRSLSRVVTHNGVVLVRPKPEQSMDATARIIPTLKLNTVGAKLRISF